LALSACYLGISGVFESAAMVEQKKRLTKIKLIVEKCSKQALVILKVLIKTN
jgi:hypothetical protein